MHGTASAFPLRGRIRACDLALAGPCSAATGLLGVTIDTGLNLRAQVPAGRLIGRRSLLRHGRNGKHERRRQSKNFLIGYSSGVDRISRRAASRLCGFARVHR